MGWLDQLGLQRRSPLSIFTRACQRQRLGITRHGKGSLITDRRDYLYLVVREESGAS